MAHRGQDKVRIGKTLTYNASEKEVFTDLVDDRDDLISMSDGNGSSGKEAILYVDDDERWNGRGIEFRKVRLVDGSIGHDSTITLQNGVLMVDPLILVR